MKVRGQLLGVIRGHKGDPNYQCLVKVIIKDAQEYHCGDTEWLWSYRGNDRGPEGLRSLQGHFGVVR